MFVMSIDNICWIPDGNQYHLIKPYFFVFTVPWFSGKRYEFVLPKTRIAWKYIWHKRVLEVLKHPRDVLPGIITSGIMVIWLLLRMS